MIKLVSVNIERSKHLGLVLPFLEAQQADVVCVQELIAEDIPLLEKAAGSCAAFAPVVRHVPDRAGDESRIMGSGIFTSLPVRSTEIMYYRGSEENALRSEPRHIMQDIPLVIADIEQDGAMWRFCTTHFTWTPDGSASQQQRLDMHSLLAILAHKEGFVLCGDFNAPRGGEVFSVLAEKYKDNIPSHYTTSIDKYIHRAGDLQLMVDGLFSTPEYEVSNVELRSGVSDHLAITATVERSKIA